MHRIQREQGEFSVGEMTYNNLYYRACLDDETFAYLHFQMHPDLDFVQIHLTLMKWNLSVARALRWGFENIVKPLIRSFGISQIAGVKDRDTEPWLHLMQFLGFDPWPLDDTGAMVVRMEV